MGQKYDLTEVRGFLNQDVMHADLQALSASVSPSQKLEALMHPQGTLASMAHCRAAQAASTRIEDECWHIRDRSKYT